MRILPFIPALCILGMGVIFIGLGFSAKRSASRLEAEGITHTGTITKAEVQKGSKGKKRYLVRVTWGEGDLAKTDDPFVVTKTFFLSRASEDGVVSDSAVTLRSLPGDPGSTILVGGTSDLSGIEWLGYFVGSFGAFMLIRALRRRSPARV